MLSVGNTVEHSLVVGPRELDEFPARSARFLCVGGGSDIGARSMGEDRECDSEAYGPVKKLAGNPFVGISGRSIYFLVRRD